MATVQARMLSWRYRTERLARYWSKNPHGVCLLPSCLASGVHETLTHILLECPSLNPARCNLQTFTVCFMQQLPSDIQEILSEYCAPLHSRSPQFLVDCSSLPEVIQAVQKSGDSVLHHLFRVTRTWCYTLHKERLRLLGRWNIFV